MSEVEKVAESNVSDYIQSLFYMNEGCDLNMVTKQALLLSTKS